jgi:DNA-binding beta-propeller fold protein YncE
MIFVIDTATNTVAATVPVEGRPFGIAIIPLPPVCWYWSNSSQTRGYWDFCQ